MFGCKHDWTLIDKTVMKSGYEQLGSATKMEHVGPWMFQVGVSLTLTCKKCGRLQHYMDRNPT